MWHHAAMTPAIIFDLDGTLSDPSRRRHLLHGDDRNFSAFEHEAGNDPVVEPIKRLLLTLRLGNAIVLTTGRTERFRPLTAMWLARSRRCSSWWTRRHRGRLCRSAQTTPGSMRSSKRFTPRSWRTPSA